jgi:hypothetical protein
MFLEFDAFTLLYSLRNTDHEVPYHVILFISALLHLHTFKCLFEPNVRTSSTNKNGLKILATQYVIANFSHVGKLKQLLKITYT